MSEPVTDTAIPELSAQDRLNALTPADRATWDLTGEWPEPAKVTTTADADDDEPEPEPAPVPETTVGDPPAPVPAEAAKLATERRTGKVSRQQQINDLIRDSTESKLRAKALEAEIQALKAGKTAPEPVAEPEPAPIVNPTNPEPQEASFDDYRAFVKAQAKWEIRQAGREAKAEADKTQRTRAQAAKRTELETSFNGWIERRTAFEATTPDFHAQTNAFLAPLEPGTVFYDAIIDSEVGPQMALYLSTHKDEADRIGGLAPAAALRALGKIEAKFDTTDTTTSTSASAGPAAKTVTTAPAPPTTLAARSASPADPAAAALARGDYVAWEAEENRKALAAGR